MYPCQHGELLYKSYGVAYCRCQHGYEGVYCEKKMDTHKGHWWSSFMDGLRKLVWGNDDSSHSHHDSANAMVRPPGHHWAPSSTTWIPSSTTWAPTTTSTIPSTTQQSNANDSSFVIGFMIAVFAIFCVSCVIVAFCCWKIRSRKKNEKKKSGTQICAGNGDGNVRPHVAVLEQTRIQEMPDAVEPPTYEEAVAQDYVK